MRKFFVVLVWVMGLGLAALFAKDIVRGVKNGYCPKFCVNGNRIQL